jgi:hypothetical protein
MTKFILFFLIIVSLAFTREIGARYLIITHDNYYNALQPLAEWKTRKGFKTKIVTLSDIGSSDSAQIRNYILNAYTDWQIKPEYVLLVGDKSQIPFPQCSYHGHIYRTDNYYTNLMGDYKNEIIPGRFWVYSTNNLETVIAKVLSYDKDPYIDDSLWFRKGVTIVNEYEPPPPSDSVYWADARYTYNLMLDAGYTHIDSFATSFGNSSSDVHNAINDGRSYILYRGVGLGEWGYPFDNISPSMMNNGFKLPIVVSGTCGTIEGIGYEWLNAGTPEQPKGVVGFFGTTTALMDAAELRSALAKGTFESIFCDSFTTLGKACENGRQAVYDLGLELSEMEYESWTCLGDPEMTVWTTTPRQIDVSYDSMLLVGSCTLSVNVQCNSMPVESALVCVMAKQDSAVYRYGRTDSLGNIEFIDEFQIPSDLVFITVTGRNLKPYCGKIIVTDFIEEIQTFQYHNSPSFSIHPNPFREKTEIMYSVGRSAKSTTMKIYDATGRLIKNLSLPTAFSTLPTSFTWDGTDDRGVHVPEGIYFATFETDTYKMIKKIILIK